MKPGCDVAPLPAACDTAGQRRGGTAPEPGFAPSMANGENRGAEGPGGGQEQHSPGTVVTITSRTHRPLPGHKAPLNITIPPTSLQNH